MKKKSFGRFLLWALFFLLVLAVLDQFLLRVSFKSPVLSEFRAFYLDFRGRLLQRPPSTPEARHVLPKRAETGPRYVYVDEKGDISFADSLEEVPPRFREDARPLEK